VSSYYREYRFIKASAVVSTKKDHECFMCKDIIAKGSEADCIVIASFAGIQSFYVGNCCRRDAINERK
jgi:hypothetical protein